MSRRVRPCGVALRLSALALLLSAAARGQPAPSASAPPAASAPPPAASAASAAEAERKLEEAKAEFRKGVALLNAGDYERALGFFQLSRAAYPSRQNTINAALCLEKLKRYDESLELYEEVLARFSKELSEQEREAVVATAARLRSGVGSLELSANVESASVSVDGRARGRLPLSGPLRLMSGPHLVRVAKDGYATFEQKIELRAGERVALDARLEALTSTGGLRIEDAAAKDADVFVDGAFLGSAPWEGVLAPGPHVISSRKGAVGSAPTLATVVQGQVALVRLASGPLGPTLRVRVAPSTAALRLGGVPLGKGSWEGALPQGSYRFEASEPGYFDAVVEVEQGQQEQGEVVLSLRRDEAHPRWPRSEAGRLWVGAFGGALVTKSMRGDIEANCPARCSQHTLTTGGWAGLRLGFELPFGLSPELSGGFLTVSSQVSRSQLTAPFVISGVGTAQTLFRLDELLRLKGYFVALGVSQRVPIRGSLSLLARLSGGVLFATSSVTTTARAALGSDEMSASSVGADTSAASTPLLVEPELGLGWTVGTFRLGASLGSLFVLNQGPALRRGSLSVANTCGPSGAASAGCTPVSELDGTNDGKDQGQRVYGTFSLFAAQLSVSREF